MSLITIYVRKPVESTKQRELRRLSCLLPLAIPQHDLLESGYGIDGTQIVRDVVADGSKPFPELLVEAERDMVGMLQGAGYQVEFA